MHRLLVICRKKVLVPPLASLFPSIPSTSWKMGETSWSFQQGWRRVDVRKEGQDWWRQGFSLSLPEIPPVEVVAGGWSMSTEDPPAPLVHQVAKGQEGNFL